MKNLIAVLAFLVGAGVASADSTVSNPAPGWPETTAPRHTMPAGRTPSTPMGSQKAVAMPAAQTPTIDQDAPTNITALQAETVTVTGTRPRSFDINEASGFVSFSSVSPRSLSSPLTLDLITDPVLLRMKTGNAPERVNKRIDFPFESVQDRTARGLDFLQIKLYTLKFD